MWIQYKDQITSSDNTTDIRLFPEQLKIVTYYAGAECCDFKFDNRKEFDEFEKYLKEELNESWIWYKNIGLNLDNVTDVQLFRNLKFAAYYGGIECCSILFEEKDTFDIFVDLFLSKTQTKQFKPF